MRIVGLSADPSFDTPAGKNAGLFGALSAVHDVVGLVRPRLSQVEEGARKLRRFHPDRATWRRRFNLDPTLFERRTAIASVKVRALQPDLVVQLHTLLGPPPELPYVLHTDNTYRLSERYWPDWAPLRGAERERWLALETAVYRGAKRLFPRSAWLARSFVEDYGCDPVRVVVVGGGWNFGVERLERTWDKPVALFVGLDFRRKGGDTLLGAWRRVREVVPGAELWVVGESRAPEPGVVWWGEVRDRAKLGALYAQARVFVMPSLFEPWGHVFHEAMAHGVPCIGSLACAMPEIIVPGTGVCVPPGDVGALELAMRTYLGSPEGAEHEGRAAHARMMGSQRWAHVVERMGV